MNLEHIPDNPYLLLTPGPLSTSKGVRAALLRDWCTWDAEYNQIVQNVRAKLVELACARPNERGNYTCALMQGSGTFSVESVIGSALADDGRLLVLANGAYGQRIAKIAKALRIDHVVHDSGETARPDLERLAATLRDDAKISHVAAVHCETTTGMLNPAAEIGRVVTSYGRMFILDAMSSFGGVDFDPVQAGADFLISSANKCIQGVPGFGFIVAKREAVRSCEGRARSLSLDLFDQWQCMEEQNGKWRFTSPTHTVRAFARALEELAEEGGMEVRARRYRENHRRLVAGMRTHGFRTLLPDELQSPIITAFHNPDHPDYEFTKFYEALKAGGFVIYPGKVSSANTFRIGTIGHLFPADVDRLIAAVGEAIYWQ